MHAYVYVYICVSTLNAHVKYGLRMYTILRVIA